VELQCIRFDDLRQTCATVLARVRKLQANTPAVLQYDTQLNLAGAIAQDVTAPIEDLSEP